MAEPSGIDEIMVSGDLDAIYELALILTDEELLSAYHKTDQNRTKGIGQVLWNEFYERLSNMLPSGKENRK